MPICEVHATLRDVRNDFRQAVRYLPVWEIGLRDLEQVRITNLIPSCLLGWWSIGDGGHLLQDIDRFWRSTLWRRGYVPPGPSRRMALRVNQVARFSGLQGQLGPTYSKALVRSLSGHRIGGS
jgi:hypothetical protein